MQLSKREKNLVSLLIMLVAFTISFFFILGPGYTMFMTTFDTYQQNDATLNEMHQIMDNATTIETEFNQIKPTLVENEKNIYPVMPNYELQTILANDAATNGMTLVAMSVNVGTTPSVVPVAITVQGSLESFTNYINYLNTSNSIVYVTTFKQGNGSDLFDVTLELVELKPVAVN